MNILAARLVFKVPITWMTGYYRLENAKLFHFIPAGGDGNFNIDLKYMTIEVIFTLKSTNTPLILSRMNAEMNNSEKATVDSFGPQYNNTDAVSNIEPRKVERIFSLKGPVPLIGDTAVPVLVQDEVEELHPAEIGEYLI